MEKFNIWGVMFFVTPMITGLTIGSIIVASEIFKFLGRISK